jgi:hypothetical protein
MGLLYLLVIQICTRKQILIIQVVKSRKIRYAGHVARTGDRRGVYRVLVGRPEGMIKTGNPGRIWDDNIKIDPQELGQGEQGLRLSG